jgi:hypothetical protein
VRTWHAGFGTVWALAFLASPRSSCARHARQVVPTKARVNDEHREPPSHGLLRGRRPTCVYVTNRLAPNQIPGNGQHNCAVLAWREPEIANVVDAQEI